MKFVPQHQYVEDFDGIYQQLSNIEEKTEGGRSGEGLLDEVVTRIAETFG